MPDPQWEVASEAPAPAQAAPVNGGWEVASETNPGMDAALHKAYDSRPLWRKVLGLDPEESSLSPELKAHMGQIKQAAQKQLGSQLQGVYSGYKEGIKAGVKGAPFVAVPGLGGLASEAVGGGLLGTAASAGTQAAASGLIAKAGGASNTDAAIAAGLGAGSGLLSGAAKALPSAERAGQAFQEVKSVAGQHTVDVSQAGNSALRIQQLAERGGSMPQVIRKFLVRVTDPEKPPLTYDEARDFYSNASRLSADETKRLTPVLRYEVGKFTRSLGSSIEDTANSVGKLQQFQQAMKEYASAKNLESVKENVKDAAIYAAKRAIPGAAAYYGAKELLNK